MTWVVGWPGIFGYAVGISDVRVTFADKSERDCLQKVHRIGRNLVLGFAGSVKIGLTIAQQLGAELDGRDAEAMWNPLQVAEGIPAPTKLLFRGFPSGERKLGCNLMLLSAHPAQNDGDAPWARCYVHRFYAPDFLPTVAIGREIVAIGSGANLPQYAQALGKLQSDDQVLKLEAMTPTGSAFGHLLSLSAAINAHPVPGISPHLHLCLVRRDGISIGRNDRLVPDHPDENFIMPPVARTWSEFASLVAPTHASLELATC